MKITIKFNRNCGGSGQIASLWYSLISVHFFADIMQLFPLNVKKYTGSAGICFPFYGKLLWKGGDCSFQELCSCKMLQGNIFFQPQ